MFVSNFAIKNINGWRDSSRCDKIKLIFTLKPMCIMTWKCEKAIKDMIIINKLGDDYINFGEARLS